MKQQARLALEFFLPPILAVLPIAFREMNSDPENNGVMVLLISVFFSFMATCVPVFVSALIMEAAFKRGLDPKEKKAVGFFASLGLLSGIAVSVVLMDAHDLPQFAASGFFAWGVTSLIVLLIERRAQKRLNKGNQLTST